MRAHHHLAAVFHRHALPWWACACLGPLLMLGLGVLAGCASGPPTGPEARSRPPPAARAPEPAPRGADGPPEGVAPDPLSTPDALPRVEPIRLGGPNKPYEVAGQTYVPMTQDEPLVETGLASWYGRKFHGRRTASGELYNMHAMTAAHKTMPLPSFARVRNPANGREIVVRINDRGPFVAGRIIDLSYAAAIKLGVPSLGRVEVIRLTHDDIRAMAATGDPLVGAAAGTSAAPSAQLPAAPPAATPAAPWTTTTTARTEPKDPLLVAAAQAEARRGREAPPTGNGTLSSPAPTPSPVPTLGAPVRPPDPVTPPPAPDAAPAMDLSGHPDMPGAVPNGGPLRAYTQAAGGFWLQLGAFTRSEGAMGFHQRISQDQGWLAPLLAVFVDGRIHRLQAGPYASRQLAQEAAERVQATLQLLPLVIERR